MTRILVVLVTLVSSLAIGQTANTSGGCPQVMTTPTGGAGLQCTMANAMVGVDAADSTLTWRTTFRFFNRDTVAHSGMEQTVSPDGSEQFPVMWSIPSGGTGVWTNGGGGGIAPIGGTWVIFTGATPTTIATPFAVTLLALQASDKLPALVGETLVQQFDAAGNIKRSYAVADPATVTNAPGTVFGVQVDAGYPGQDVALIVTNPDPSAMATVTVAIWNGYNDTADYVIRRQKESVASVQVFVAPGTTVSQTVSQIFANDSAYQSFVSAPAWPTGAPNGTASIAVVASNVPVNVGAIRVNINPDQTMIMTPGFAFPLVPQN